MRTLFLPLLFLLISCSGNTEDLSESNVKKPSTTPPALPSMKGVYIAGYENNQACYWKDNQKVVLTDGADFLATKIFVDDHHTYVISTQPKTGDPYIWIDNVKKKMNDYYNLPASDDIYFMNAHLDHNDLYVLAVVYNPNEPTADKYEVCYWKNGIKTSLTKVSNFQKIRARNITVHGKDVYVAISMTEQYTGKILDDGYYKNGQYFSLNKTGYYLDGAFGDDNNLKLMYRNNVTCMINIVDLLNNSSQVYGFSNPNKMFYDNGNTYVKGISEVLKNNTKIHVSYDGGVYYNILDFEVSGNDSYIIKEYATANPYYQVVYKNNMEYKKMIPSVDKGSMFDIFIKD